MSGDVVGSQEAQTAGGAGFEGGCQHCQHWIFTLKSPLWCLFVIFEIELIICWHFPKRNIILISVFFLLISIKVIFPVVRETVWSALKRPGRSNIRNQVRPEEQGEEFRSWWGRQTDLKANIRRVCQKYGESAMSNVHTNWWIYDSNNNLMFCRQAKVCCTITP